MLLDVHVVVCGERVLPLLALQLSRPRDEREEQVLVDRQRQTSLHRLARHMERVRYLALRERLAQRFDQRLAQRRRGRQLSHQRDRVGADLLRDPIALGARQPLLPVRGVEILLEHRRSLAFAPRKVVDLLVEPLQLLSLVARLRERFRRPAHRARFAPQRRRCGEDPAAFAGPLLLFLMARTIRSARDPLIAAGKAAEPLAPLMLRFLQAFRRGHELCGLSFPFFAQSLERPFGSLRGHSGFTCVANIPGFGFLRVFLGNPHAFAVEPLVAMVAR